MEKKENYGIRLIPMTLIMLSPWMIMAPTLLYLSWKKKKKKMKGA